MTRRKLPLDGHRNWPYSWVILQLAVCHGVRPVSRFADIVPFGQQGLIWPAIPARSGVKHERSS